MRRPNAALALLVTALVACGARATDPPHSAAPRPSAPPPPARDCSAALRPPAMSTPSDGPPLSLSLLVPENPPPSAASATPLPPVDLGAVVVHATTARPSAMVDVSWLGLPDDAPLGLPPQAAGPWSALVHARAALRKTMVDRAATEEALARCADARCPDGLCLRRMLADADAALARGRRDVPALEEAARRAVGAVAERPDATFGAVLAAASLEEDHALATADGEPRLDRAVSLYHRAVALTPPEGDAGFFARYGLARVLDAKGDREGAARVLRELDRTALAPARAADVAYRLADYETDVARAVERYRRAATLADRAQVGPLRAAALYRAVQLDVHAGMPREVLRDAAPLVTGADPGDLRDDAIAAMGAAIADLAPSDGADLPSVAPRAFATIALAAARRALDRRDVEGGLGTLRAIAERTPNALEAKVAIATLVAEREHAGDLAAADAWRGRLASYREGTPWAAGLRASRDARGEPTDARIAAAIAAPPLTVAEPATGGGALATELRARAFALAEACEPDRLPSPLLAIRIDVWANGRVAARAGEGPEGSGDIAACVDRLAPRFFASARASVRATLRVDAP